MKLFWCIVPNLEKELSVHVPQTFALHVQGNVCGCIIHGFDGQLVVCGILSLAGMTRGPPGAMPKKPKGVGSVCLAAKCAVGRGRTESGKVNIKAFKRKSSRPFTALKSTI